jgi:pilus assembly protein CpaE
MCTIVVLATGAKSNMAGKKILVVDDDQGIRRLVELMLHRAGYQVVTASTGETAIEMVRTEKPDLVLMDVMLPGMNGFQATQQMRRIPEGSQIPIVFLSSQVDMEAKMKGLRGGGNDYITKPVKTGELLARIEAHLRPEGAVVGQVITLWGSKAGVGTTTVAINLALALRKALQKKVLLLDWQRPLGDIAFLLGLPEARALELFTVSSDLDEEKLAKVMIEYSPGVWVIPGAADPNTAKQMDKKTLKRVLDNALLQVEYVLVDVGFFFSWDLPPAAVKGQGINLCVSVPEPTSIKRTAQVIGALNGMDCDFWPILNRQGMPGSIPQEQIESHLGITFKGFIPDESEQMMRALNARRPLYTASPDSDFARAMNDLANRIVQAL